MSNVVSRYIWQIQVCGWCHDTKDTLWDTIGAGGAREARKDTWYKVNQVKDLPVSLTT